MSKCCDLAMHSVVLMNYLKHKLVVYNQYKSIYPVFRWDSQFSFPQQSAKLDLFYRKKLANCIIL